MSGNETNGAPVVRYAIRRKKDGRYFSGVCFCYTPPHVILCDEAHPALLFDSIESLVNDPAVGQLNMLRFQIVELSGGNARVVPLREWYSRKLTGDISRNLQDASKSLVDLSCRVKKLSCDLDALCDTIKASKSEEDQNLK